jgi:RNA polymerase sigma factor (sigma-70 family)
MSKDDLLSELHEGRQRFLALVEGLRPERHRYCARMTGSVIDGEDIVQETLARAYYVLPELTEVPPLRPWLFRIAHNRALDHLRRYDRRMGQTLELVPDSALETPTPDPEEALARDEAVRAAVSRFVELPPSQRSCVILKDVLSHSLEEIAELLTLTVPAVKAALHRGRAQLRAQTDQPWPVGAASPEVARYAALFNARDWDGVREMLADDVRLDLVSRAERGTQAGRQLPRPVRPGARLAPRAGVAGGPRGAGRRPRAGPGARLPHRRPVRAGAAPSSSVLSAPTYMQWSSPDTKLSGSPWVKEPVHSIGASAARLVSGLRSSSSKAKLYCLPSSSGLAASASSAPSGSTP